MPVWLTLLGGLLATALALGGLFGAVSFFVQGKKVKGGPKLQVFPAGGNGKIGVAVHWDAGTYDVQFYRVRLLRVSPDFHPKESTTTMTFETPYASSFRQLLDLPAEFREVAEKPDMKALITLEVRSTEEYSLIKNFTAQQFRKLYSQPKYELGGEPPVAEAIGADVPSVLSLDYAELVERKKKVKALKAAADAKAAKKPAAAPAAGATKEASAESNA